ncbi:MAG: amidohydrolase [Verrucomicrobiales bacterium]|nr:amidohydrolase [Verrucomicrobiales bacterium]
MKTSTTSRLSLFLALFLQAFGQGESLQELSRVAQSLPRATIYTAKEIVTLDPARPRAEAVAVVGDRILAVGSLAELKAAAGDQPYLVDRRFDGRVIVPGFIAQHDHPFLAALTMESEIISIEDWVLPSGTVPAAKDHNEYVARLTAAERALKDPNETLLTWGYHHYFHGKLSRADLDKTSATRPIIVWHRSAHEFIVNTKALETFGVTREFVEGFPQSAKDQSNYDEGHFWEQGLFAVLGKFAPAVATPERIRSGLEFLVSYLQSNGVTLGCEPGGILSKSLQDAENAVLSNRSNPFRFYFIADGKSLVAAYPDTALAETEKLLSWGDGKTAFLPRQVKLFADGAIYSQAMQLRQPYTDGHKGEWMMDLGFFQRSFRIYWDAGYQIHVHVNGDAGLDMVLDTLEENLRRRPRNDHRTVIVHFAVSAKDQVSRIQRLGAIVSGNPYYTAALADNYSTAGLGPERANAMVRLGDVERAGVSFSLHSDMPMAPAQPLFLMYCAVNRRTQSGRVADESQRISREGALRAVTLDAAYSLQMEKEVGSIVSGKLANFTILGENPVTCDAAKIKDIAVIGTVHEGQVFQPRRAAKQSAGIRWPGKFVPVVSTVPIQGIHDHGIGCSCATGRCLAGLLFSSLDPGSR